MREFGFIRLPITGSCQCSIRCVVIRRTLASTMCRTADPVLVDRPRELRDASTVMRSRPAHRSEINHRHDGRAYCFAWQSLPQMPEKEATNLLAHYL